MPTAVEDRFIAEIWSLGTLGLESSQGVDQDPEYLAYFSSPAGEELLQLMEGQITLAGLSPLECAEIDSVDWQAVYRARVKPFALGERWWVDPREPGEAVDIPPDDRTLLQIPARTAFGTGSHPSTALVVEIMEDIRLKGHRVLDVGTGTGILAMIALASGARSVIALDIDPIAVFVASETCALNGFIPRLVAGDVSVLDPGSAESFDLILANVLLSSISDDYPRLARALRPSGTLLLSGILDAQESGVVSRFSALGLTLQGHRQRDDWVSLELEKTR